MAKTVVILGAGFTGIAIAHKLLKYTLPKLPDLKVVLVSPSTHFFWNVAATRGVIPGEFTDEELYIPIEQAFAQYKPGSFEFVQGLAEDINITGNSVRIEMIDGSRKHLGYDQLVIATGSRLASGLPFKLIGSYKETLSAWKELQKKIGEAKSIVISGGGPTAVELAAELAERYGRDKEVTLIMSGSEPLPTACASVRKVAAKDLATIGVRIMPNARVTSTEENSKGTTTITTSTGHRLKANLYLPFHGITLNSSFIPNHLLDSKGSLALGPDMRVSGTTNIWGIGDIGNLDPKQAAFTDRQVIHVGPALDAVLTGSGEPKTYQPSSRAIMAITMGRKHSTGHFGDWRVPGFLLNYMRGRTLFVETAKGYVGGEFLRHAKM